METHRFRQDWERARLEQDPELAELLGQVLQALGDTGADAKWIDDFRIGDSAPERLADWPAAPTGSYHRSMAQRRAIDAAISWVCALSGRGLQASKEELRDFHVAGVRQNLQLVQKFLSTPDIVYFAA